MQVKRSHDRIGGWTLLKPIGKGGMGQVFKVNKTTEMGQSLLGVMKLPLATNVGDESTIRRWKSEVRVMTLVQGRANVVQILDVGTDGGIFFYVMEYVHGADLSRFTAALRRARVQLTPSIVAWIVGEMLNGLASVHAIAIDGQPQNVCHKDVALKNVLASTAGDIKLADFGIATVGRALGMSNRGTLNYMAPEHFMGAPTQKSDVFATMVCAWELLEGERYRPGLDDDALRANAYATPFRPLRRTDVSPKFAELIAAGLSPLETDRYTADEGLVRVEGLPEYRVERRAARELLVAHVRGIQGSGRTELVRPQPLVATPDLAGLFAAEMVLQNTTGSRVPSDGFETDDPSQAPPSDADASESASASASGIPAWPSVEAPAPVDVAPKSDAAVGPPPTLPLRSSAPAASTEPAMSSTLRLVGAPPPPATTPRTVRLAAEPPSAAPSSPSSPTPRITMPWGIDDDAARPDVDDSASPPIESEPHDEVDTSDEVTPVPLARVDASITGPAEADPVTDRVSDTGSPAVATSPEPPRSSRVGWLAACAAVVSIIAGGTAASMLTDDDGAAAVASAAGGLRAPAAPELVLPVAAPPERTAAPGAMRAPSTEAPLRPRDAATSSSELDPAATSTTAATADAPAPDADPPSTPRKRPAIPHVDVAIRVMWIDAGIDLKIGSKRAAVDADGTLRVAAGKHRVSWRERGMTAWTDAGVQDFSAGARHVLRIGKTGGAGGVAHDVRPEGGK